MQIDSSWFTVRPEVREAHRAGKPVVALESTIISHGMPYPQNLATAEEVESIISDEGALPATIGIINGKIHVGLSREELSLLASHEQVLKVSIRDLPYVVTKKLNGATTVAATLYAANLAKIPIFVTGGIGGVHRGVSECLDISADLLELAKGRTAVVSSGAKSILDIVNTLEYLETLGVPLLGYQTDEFPAFYSRSSGHKVSCRCDTPQEVADFIKTKWQMGLAGGVLIANPIPSDDAMNQEEIEQIIEKALDAASQRGIRGKEVTPFLLSFIKDITAGASLTANIALIKNNARVGARIARALSSSSP